MATIRPRPRTSPTTRSWSASGAEQAHELPAARQGVGLQVVGQQVVEVGQRPGRGERVAPEGGNGVGLDGIHEVGPTGDTADGQAIAEALGERQQVGQ